MNLDLEALGIILTLIAGITGIVIQIWQRYDSTRESIRQGKIDLLTYGLDEKKTGSELQSRQAEMHLSVTQTLRSELDHIRRRQAELQAEYDEFREKSSARNDALSVIFDEIEAALLDNGKDKTTLISTIRKFRRDWAI